MCKLNLQEHVTITTVKSSCMYNGEGTQCAITIKFSRLENNVTSEINLHL